MLLERADHHVPDDRTREHVEKHQRRAEPEADGSPLDETRDGHWVTDEAVRAGDDEPRGAGAGQWRTPAGAGHRDAAHDAQRPAGEEDDDGGGAEGCVGLPGRDAGVVFERGQADRDKQQERDPKHGRLAQRVEDVSAGRLGRRRVEKPAQINTGPGDQTQTPVIAVAALISAVASQASPVVTLAPQQ